MIKKAVLALALAGALLGLVASPVQADDKSKASAVGILACNYHSNTGTGSPFGGGIYNGAGQWYAYSTQRVVPSWSSCNDIQSPVRYSGGPYPTPLNVLFRVRFYPTSFPTYVGPWTSNNINTGSNLILATNVANGTRYRIETARVLNDGTQIIEPHNFDLMD